MTETFQQKVATLQSELIAPKKQFNSFGKYNYRSAEDILEAVKPLNKSYELLLFITDEPVLIGDRYYVRATATLMDAKDTTQQIVATGYAREAENKKGQDESQITGTASSYARKYALNGLYLIDDTKDADTDEHQKQKDKAGSSSTKATTDKTASTTTQNTTHGLISEPQTKALKAKLNNIFKQTEQSPAVIYNSSIKHLGINKATKDLTKAEASKVIDYLSKLEMLKEDK